MEKITFVYGGFGDALYLNSIRVLQGTDLSIFDIVRLSKGEDVRIDSFTYDTDWFFEKCKDGKFPKFLKDVKILKHD